MSSNIDTFGKIDSIPIDKIWADDSFNCRTIEIDENSIDELKQSIKQEGLAIPIIVQEAKEVKVPENFDYFLICGFRRYYACKLLGYKKIAANIRVGLTDRQRLFLNFIENIERKNLTVLEEAHRIDKLFPVYRTNKSIAEELKKSEHWVRIRRELLSLPDEIQTKAHKKLITATDIGCIVRSPNPEEKARKIIEAGKKRQKYQETKNFGKRKSKKQVYDLITQLLNEGFSIQFLRLLGWTTGNINEDELKEALQWLRSKKKWLK